MGSLSQFSCFCFITHTHRASQGLLVVKNLPANAGGERETQVSSLGWGDLLKEDIVTHSSSLSWRIPLTEEPGGL